MPISISIGDNWQYYDVAPVIFSVFLVSQIHVTSLLLQRGCVVLSLPGGYASPDESSRTPDNQCQGMTRFLEQNRSQNFAILLVTDFAIKCGIILDSFLLAN